MESDSETDMLTLLLSYKEMAMDPSKHKIIIQDKTMVQFLAYCVDSDDEKAVSMSLETLDLLVKNRRNHTTLRTTFGVLEAILATARRDDLPNDLIQTASRLHSTLESSAYSRPPSPPSQPKRNVFTFHVFGLNEDTSDELVSCLVGVKGVVSVVVDVPHQRVTVRALAEPTKYAEPLTPTALADVVRANTNMYASLVVKNNYDQEVLEKSDLDLPFNNSSLPEYLPEDDSPVKEKAIISFDKIRSNASSWVRSASAFLQEAFYW